MRFRISSDQYLSKMREEQNTKPIQEHTSQIFGEMNVVEPFVRVGFVEMKIENEERLKKEEAVGRWRDENLKKKMGSFKFVL